jgi:ATP/maltotriose-dependent transcriptional regulator MalT
LADSGEEATTRRAFLAWSRQLADEAGLALVGAAPNEDRWYVYLHTERHNLRAALQWATEIEPETALRLAGIYLWILAEQPAEAQRWLEIAVEAGQEGPAALRYAALRALCVQAGMAGDFAEAERRAREGHTVATETGDPALMAAAAYHMGLVAEWKGDAETAAARYTEAYSLARETTDVMSILTAATAQADALHACGDLEGAYRPAEEAVALARTLPGRYGLAVALNVRGHLARSMGDVALATTLFIESLTIASELGDERSVLGNAIGLASIALDRREPERAARLLRAVEAARQAAGFAHVLNPLNATRIEAHVRMALGEPAFSDAMAAGRVTVTDALQDARDAAAAAAAEAANESDKRRAAKDLLTTREHEVLRLLAEGHSDKEIASSLFIGARTVQTHVANLFAKLGVNTRAEAAAVAVRRGLV